MPYMLSFSAFVCFPSSPFIVPPTYILLFIGHPTHIFFPNHFSLSLYIAVTETPSSLTQPNQSLSLSTINLQVTIMRVPLLLLLLLLLLPTLVASECTCEVDAQQNNRTESFTYKIGAVASILIAGGIGVSLPLLGRRVEAFNPENDIFFMIKAFAAGVILATGFVHILPDAFQILTSPCLKDNPWGRFPFTGFIAMMSSIGTLMVDSLATNFYKRQHFGGKQVNVDEEKDDDHHAGHVHVHTHTTNGHAHGSATTPSSHETGVSDLIRHRIISQVSI